MTVSRIRSASPLRLVTVAAVLLVGLLAGCGSEAALPPEPTSAVTVEAASPNPDRDSEAGVSDRGVSSGGTSGSTVDEASLDEQEQLFASTVGNDYQMAFDVVSSVTAEAGPIEVLVLDGRVESVEYPDAMTERILPGIPLLTIGDFFDRARAVLRDGGVVEFEFDEFYGHPTVMNLDPVPSAIDDELSIVVRSVEPTDPGFESDGY